MNQQSVSTSAGNGASTPHDLFVLTDEQILEIEPEASPSQSSGTASEVISSEARNLSSSAASQSSQSKRDSSLPSAPRNDEMGQSAPDAAATSHDSAEPPPWLAAQMKDPWSGEEARELWSGVQQARQEAAAYRAAFATPEDARALKELYPGGVAEARSAVERARVLDDIDRAFFGVAGKSPQEVSASREQLAQQMLREDPAAFREMVFAGLRALEASGTQSNAGVGARFSASPSGSAATVGATLGSPAADADGGKASAGGASPAPGAPSVAGAPAAAGAPVGSASTHEAHVAAYAAFEKAANEDLERSVGGAIERTLAQALPNASRVSNASGVGAQHAAPLQARLSAAVRQDVESALKGDRQLGEQVTQILSGKRLDNETRSQVVRLINDRAQQLVPVAAKGVLNDWTQTTLAAHRTSSARADAASTRREVAPASLPAGPPSNSHAQQRPDPNRGATRSRAVDYRKLSDEQILDM